MSTCKHIMQVPGILFTITSVGLALTIVVFVAASLVAAILIECEKITLPNFEDMAVGAAIPVYLKSSNCTDDNTICPQDLDHNDYFYTRLGSNNLRILLISNPLASMSGVSMSVNVGSVDNPDKFQGLSHLCEHVILLGTKKYPCPQELLTYLRPFGGDVSAKSKYYDTTFQFVSRPKDLKRALDVFAQFFISPLFDEERVKKEVYIVDEEFHMKKFDEELRTSEVLMFLSRRDTPYYRFRAGNLKSLNKNGLQDELKKFYQEKYSAESVGYPI